MDLQFIDAGRLRFQFLVFSICTALALPLVGQEFEPDEQHQRWARAVLSAVSQLESLQAAQSDLAEMGYIRQAADRPIYNPEISTDYEDKSEREYAISLTQTIDWSGKRSARSRAAESALSSAEYRYSNVKNAMFASALYALGEYEVARQYADLSQQQVNLLQQLFDITESRFAVGDLGALDVELARLSLSEALYAAARASSELRIAQGLVESEAGQIMITPLPQFSSTQMPGINTIERLVDNIPEVREAQYQFLNARDVVGIAESQRRADPTVSLGSGKDGPDSVVALTLSIPLYVRNRYTAEVSASNEAATAAELRYVNLRRIKLAELGAASESYRRLSEDFQRWQVVTEQRFDESRELLLLLWESGDITTAEYVFGLQQNVLAVRAGASFSRDVFVALITWLESSGQAVSWLESISQQTNSQ
ncbi:MAG: hypothetical protein COB36_09895 [Alphaproteobacteria bacterium]|nr:MAG: hypothetical protein COB36_09895 [Alphaproteobacteria bacterium]